MGIDYREHRMKVRSSQMNRRLMTFVAPSLMLFLVWVSGTNLLERGPATGLAYFLAILSGVAAYTYPGWNK